MGPNDAWAVAVLEVDDNGVVDQGDLEAVARLSVQTPLRWGSLVRRRPVAGINRPAASSYIPERRDGRSAAARFPLLVPGEALFSARYGGTSACATRFSSRESVSSLLASLRRGLFYARCSRSQQNLMEAEAALKRLEQQAGS